LEQVNQSLDYFDHAALRRGRPNNADDRLADVQEVILHLQFGTSASDDRQDLVARGPINRADPTGDAKMRLDRSETNWSLQPVRGAAKQHTRLTGSVSADVVPRGARDRLYQERARRLVAVRLREACE